MTEPFGHLDGEFIDMEIPWPMERVQQLALEVIDVFAAAAVQPGPNFEVELTPEQVQFIGKAMVVQMTIMKMWRAHRAKGEADDQG